MQTKGSDILDKYIDDWFELDMFVATALEGLGYLTHLERVTEFIRERAVKSKDHPLQYDEVYSERKRFIEKARVFTEAQMLRGFPYLYSLAAIRLWSILESAVSELVLCALRDYERAVNLPSVTALKGELLPFIRATPDEQAAFLLSLLTRQLRAPLMEGPGRFEEVLNSVQLGGKIDDWPRRAIFELSEVRNVIVHQNSRCDKRLAQKCPWLGLKPGEGCWPNAMWYEIYHSASMWYLLELQVRSSRVVKPSEELANQIKEEIPRLQAQMGSKIEELFRRRGGIE